MDVNELLRPRLEEADLEIPGVGTIRVRGLSRYEVLMSQKLHEKGVIVAERFMLAKGVVDPVMTEDQAAQWQKASPAGEIEPVTRKIRDLSGVGKGADEEAYKSVRGEPGTGVRVLPGAEAGDDGEPAADGDVV